jgi:hypothetical protein
MNWLPALALAGGLLARLYEAWAYFLNPDEALHNLLASQASLSLAYKAALTNAHPPLLILVLYYWRWLGQSELMLRMPSVLAGTACCWIIFQWLMLVTDRSTAFIGLTLFAFAPALVGLSAEVRQYALLWFFMSGCLYLSERALREDSTALMTWFSASLYGALLTHYSSLIFAFTVGIYILVRLYPYGNRLRLVAVWAAGQIVALALIAYFLVTHVAALRQRGMPQGIAETWLRRSIFHAREDNAFVFVAAQTLRVFTYLLSHGVGGALALLAFLIGVASLLKRKTLSRGNRPSSRELALLLGLPFLVNCGVALAGIYPYGATRHNAFLAVFALSGASIGLAGWQPPDVSIRPVSIRPGWIRPLIVLTCLAVCNFFPSPPPLIRARNHRRSLMEQAGNAVRASVSPGSTIFADYQSGLLLGYYLCDHGVVQIFPPLQPFAKSDCGPYTVITARPEEWKFYAEDFPTQLERLTQIHRIAPGTRLWLFDAGWITDTAPTLRGPLQQRGCPAPQTFGENILLCQFEVGEGGRPQPEPEPQK